VRVLVVIQRLFAVERAMTQRAGHRGLDREAFVALRSRVRERHGARLVKQIFGAAQALSVERATLPKSPPGKARVDLDRQRGPLSAFLAGPRIPIHNNDQQRDLRHVAIGQDNWQILGSESGRQVACRMYSLVLSCKQARVDPHAYLEDALGRISTAKASDIATLTPWAWAAARK
jgi:transposase